MSIVEGFRLEPMIGDPDDHRPGTVWALIVDPGDASGRVDQLAVLVEEIGAGDRIPVHRHPIDEVVFVVGDGAVATLGESIRSIRSGTIMFVPAGVAHGISNPTAIALPIRAVFPGTKVGIEYLERNPAPGTEADDPAPPVVLDLRAGKVV